MKETIHKTDDVFKMLDHLLREPKPFWEEFYTDRSKKVPFFQNLNPDENLVEYIQHDINPSKVLEIGCGPGRNAIYMAKQGCQVDALDLSENAIKWAKERATEESVDIQFFCQSLFDFTFEKESYDFIYDCGLLHHLAPHQRLTYLGTIKKALKPNGYYGLVCFNTKGATPNSDWEVYRKRSLEGGIGYTAPRLRAVFNKDFRIIKFREMKRMTEKDQAYGLDFLWVSLMQKKN